MNRTFIKPPKAAKRAGISRQKIYQDMRRGTLSVCVGPRGKVKLDADEVARVYGKPQHKD
jgi:predicted site-specific integrase-resolvase